MLVNEIIKTIENEKVRSAWSKGVKEYAIELLEDRNIDELPTDRREIEKILLNGASDWSEYSWGGSSLIYNEDIAERLCTPSELKKTKNGERRPNSRENWLDVQARALFQACQMIKRLANN